MLVCNTIEDADQHCEIAKDDDEEIVRSDQLTEMSVEYKFRGCPALAHRPLLNARFHASSVP